MTITKRLIMTFVMAMLSLLFVGNYGLWQLYQSEQRFELVQASMISGLKELSQGKDEIAALRFLTVQIFVSDSDQKDALEQAMIAADKRFDQHIAAYEQSDISNPTDSTMLQAMKANMAAYRQARQGLLEKIHQNDIEGARDFLLDTSPMYRAALALQTSINQQFSYKVELSNDAKTQNESAYRHAVLTLMSVMLLSFFATGGLATRLYRIIRRGLGSIQGSLQELSRSFDLTRPIPVTRMDEIGHTTVALNHFLARVADIVGSVRLSSDSVSAVTQQIAAGNIDLSTRTERQAASLQQTAASMAELTNMVQKNTDHALQASTLANQAAAVFDQGHEAVARMVEKMGQISSSSAKISEITNLIEGIAFQTNILALNAAVEAARAGEQGRGFAVVASEVRNLAQRSSSAAKEIKEVISASITSIDEGGSQAQEVGNTTEKARQAVKHVADLIGEIAVASTEQGHGIEQMNLAITEMDEVTQHNAALVEQASAATHTLEVQARKLDEAVAVFKVARGVEVG